MLEIECDGEHGYGTSNITSGSDIYCGECHDELKDRLADLEIELETTKADLETADQTIADLESKITELEAAQ